ncbi:MAG: hypothetical protein AXA67_05920 [Methylothermaceae bacteria B42]|nr:MAG: hypothetical protein AXA67_05920 [Methylothermaceae bacteria B42]HHJ40395.1 hypothetical protein [Methylothermaceae bacterium]
MRLLLLAFLILALVFPALSQAEKLLVIVSSDTDVGTLSLPQLARIYSRKVLIGPHGIPWAPLNLPVNHPLRQAFSQAIFKRSPEELENYWNIQYFKGILPPYVVASEKAMRQYVTSTPGAVGYIRPCHLGSGVKVVATLTLSSNLEIACQQ